MAQGNTPERCEEAGDYEVESGDEDISEVSDNEDIVNQGGMMDGSDWEGEEEMDDEEMDSDWATDNEDDTAEDGGDGRMVRLLDGSALDLSVYNLFRAFRMPWPCLSVDSFPLFDPPQTQSPLQLTFVAGGQGNRSKEHRLYLFKTKLHMKQMKKGKDQNKGPDDSDSSSSSESETSDIESDENEKDKKKDKTGKQNDEKKGSEETKKLAGQTKKKNFVHCIALMHDGACNRVRQTQLKQPNNLNLIASWSSSGFIHIHDVTKRLERLFPTRPFEISTEEESEPVQTYKGHSGEGYGLDWCKLNPARIASGNCRGELHVWELQQSNSSTQMLLGDALHFSKSRASIEDIQWSPAEETVLATCSADSSVRIWDCRTLSRSMISVDRAHSSDVNVISWNPHGDPFIVSGGDDHQLKVWDLRQLSSSCAPVASFDFHNGPITSVQWNPAEATQFAAASDDRTVSVWDLSLERETIEDNKQPGSSKGYAGQEDDNIPAQLLFLHEGRQTHIKEVTWHPSVKNLVVSTALDGLQAFIPANL